MSATAALILAGGAARRIGGNDKPLLALGGKRIIEWIIAALDAQALAISANGNPARFAPCNLPVLPDGEFAGAGPLAGVLAGLEWAVSIGARALLTIPGDTPFIPRGLSGALAPAPAWAASNGRVHYLVALWPATCHGELRRLLSAQGRRDVEYFGGLIGMRPVEFPMAKWDPFLNVNTPEDLAAARAIAKGEV